MEFSEFCQLLYNERVDPAFPNNRSQRKVVMLLMVASIKEDHWAAAERDESSFIKYLKGSRHPTELLGLIVEDFQMDRFVKKIGVALNRVHLKQVVSRFGITSENPSLEAFAKALGDQLFQIASGGGTAASIVSERYVAYMKEESETIIDEEDYKRHPLKEVSVPPTPNASEERYVIALLSVYGETENIEDFSLKVLENYPKHKEHFQRQRQDFYAAETVRRNARDLYLNDEKDQFQVLKDEIYVGIIDVYEDDWKNGLERLRRVMAQAVQADVARCWISRDTDWIGNSVKKGVCHFLVNDGRLLGWRNEDV